MDRIAFADKIPEDTARVIRKSLFVFAILLIVVLLVLFPIWRVRYAQEYILVFEQYKGFCEQAAQLLMQDYQRITSDKNTVCYLVSYQADTITKIARHPKYDRVPIADEELLVDCLNKISKLLFQYSSLSIIYVSSDRVTFCSSEAYDAIIYMEGLSIPRAYPQEKSKPHHFFLYWLSPHWYYARSIAR